MKGLAELVLSLCDLAEAEGRALKNGIRRTGQGCLLSGIGLLFAGAALAFITAAIYEALAGILPRPAAFLIMAGVCIVIAAGVLWSAKICSGKPPKKQPEKKQAKTGK